MSAKDKTRAGKSWPQLHVPSLLHDGDAILPREKPLRPLTPERDFSGNYPAWLDAVEREAPELVAYARKWGR